MAVKDVRMFCTECGSTDVVRDATAAWNEELQMWEIAGLQDAAWCNECGAELRCVGSIPIESKPGA